MLTEILLALSAGMAFGIFTGITPGIHVNLVAAGLVAASPMLLLHLSPLSLCVFIMSLAVTHSFLDTIPSTFLGAPDEQNALSALPAQKMLLQGEGYSAVKITILGAYSGLLLAVLLAPLFIIVAAHAYALAKPYLKYLLLGLASFLIMREQQRLWCAGLFLLSGTLGVIVLSMDSLREPLFCLLSGLFGVSGLLLSYFENTKIPAQKFSAETGLGARELCKSLGAATLGVLAIQFFPGTGPSQGAVMSTSVVREIREKAYLALIGAMGTMSVVFSLATFFALGNARDGSIVAMSKIMQVSFPGFLALMLSFLISGSIAVAITLWLSRKFARLMTLVNYKALVCSITIFICLLAVYFDGITGLLVLFTSCAIGLIAPLKGIPRSHAMGCLLLPVLLYLTI